MSKDKIYKIALVGNPNCGKTSLFNTLTGLNQKVGNFPGVTVDKKSGFCKLNDTTKIEIIDLPGTYSLHPKSLDEQVTQNVISDSLNPDFPDGIVVVLDATNLKRCLFLATQVIDLGFPCVFALNMMDELPKNKIEIDVEKLEEKLGVKIVPISALEKTGLNELKNAISNIKKPSKKIFTQEEISTEIIEKAKIHLNTESDYRAYIYLNNPNSFSYYHQEKSVLNENIGDKKIIQRKETILRYNLIKDILSDTYVDNVELRKKDITHQIDQIVTNPLAGILIFLLILFAVFQAIFTFSELPMQLIEGAFENLSSILIQTLPEGLLTDLLVNGVLAGLSGIVVFVPQIAFLFAFIAILEDTGYMARVSFMLDKLMRGIGLNGRSIIPLISGAACAIPAVMATRTISNAKERLITIMVVPLMSCSARIPVYTLLIALMIPVEKTFWIFNAQGLVLMAMYLVGFVAAIGVSFVFKKILKTTEKSYFTLEMPVYRLPKWNSVFLMIYEKVKTFLLEAGKVIIAISIVLWALSSFAPGDEMEKIENKYNEGFYGNPDDETSIATKHTEQLEASYAGIMGKYLEPLIKPLGFDWKIGIALITSFAAREVFVGTMATIYSVGSADDDTRPIKQKMQEEINPVSGEKVYNLATVLSLMFFYAFAMQCMSTIAIVYRETKHWKWPLLQFVYMGIMAYGSSFIIQQIF